MNNVKTFYTTFVPLYVLSYKGYSLFFWPLTMIDIDFFYGIKFTQINFFLFSIAGHF